MDSLSDCQKWFLLDAVNAIALASNSTTYKFTACLPADVKKFIISKNPNTQTYIGSTINVQVNEQGVVNGYFIWSYFMFFDAKTLKYYIGKVYYLLNNFSFDYKAYIGSSKYVKLDITLANLLPLTAISPVQGFKNIDLYGSSRVLFITGPDDSLTSTNSLTYIFRENKVYQYGASHSFTPDLNYFYPATIQFQSIGLTPSVSKLANCVLKFKPVVSGKEELDESAESPIGEILDEIISAF